MEQLVITIACLVILAIQLLLCFMLKKVLPKLIPAVLLIIAGIIFLILTVTATGWESLTYIGFLIIDVIFLIPCAVGWAIWIIYYFVSRKKKA